MDQTSNKIISSETHFEGKVFNVRTDRVLLDLGFETKDSTPPLNMFKGDEHLFD